MNKNIFNSIFIGVFLLGLTTLASAKLAGSPKFIMSTGKTVSSFDQAIALVKANQTAILNMLSANIKTLDINQAQDSENGKTNSRLVFSEIEFLFNQTTQYLPLNRTQFGREVAAIPGEGRLFLVNIPVIRKGAPYHISKEYKKVIVGTQHNVRITKMIATGVGTEVKEGDTYFDDLDISASEFRILITEEGDLYYWY